VASKEKWRSTFMSPAAASLRSTGRSMQEAVARTAEVTEQRLVKPVVHQARSAAAGTRQLFTHLVRSSPCPPEGGGEALTQDVSVL
jgi:hypothetical protein